MTKDREAFNALLESLMASGDLRPPGPAQPADGSGFMKKPRPKPEQQPVMPTPAPQTPTGYTPEDRGGLQAIFDNIYEQRGLGIPQRGTQEVMTRGVGSRGMFNDFVDKVLKHEGGYTVDQGGPTMRGITWRDNADLLTKMGYSKDTLKKLTPEHAKEIYKARYYTEPGVHKLPEDLQYYVFDFAVNSGPPKAIKKLQKVIGVKQDGVLGPETVKKVQEYAKIHGMATLKKNYVGEREQFMRNLAKQDPNKHGGSLQGWLNRINYLNKDISKEHEGIDI
jgi:lysozyme family protein